MKVLAAWLAVLAFSLPLAGAMTGPFEWKLETGGSELSVRVEIPAGCYLYADQTNVEISGRTPAKTPEVIEHKDEFLGITRIYPEGTATWVFQDIVSPVDIMIRFSGCRKTSADIPGICFMPGKLKYHFDGKTISVITDAAPATVTTSGLELLREFKVVNEAGGYMNTADFLKFLRQESASFFAGKNMFLVLLLIILGGLGLNLTPCVLPMIPINLAIIGADTQDRKQGFIRGLTYGIGIALAYGLLGLLVVLTGARFGALNSDPWFNFAIGAVFMVLALAMFEVIHIDFSRFNTGISSDKVRLGKLATALIMGIVAALLAGACVAPVVIAVLLLSAKFYAEGYWLALFLPFLLGIGMALPWPFAGAGLAVLPKPGRWMVRIKQFFGIIIVLAALWYGYQGYSLLPAKSGSGSTPAAEIAKLEKALRESSKPVLIDFWASWCKNCLAMNASTFKDSTVESELEKYTVVKFQAENMDDPQIKPILDHFNVTGLPYFVVIDK